MSRFILFFIVLFVAELLLLIEIGSVIGALECIALMFAAMVIGAVLVKLRARQLIAQMQQHQSLNVQMLWLPLAGFLFIFPGFITDVLALLVLLPPVEHFLVKHFAGSMQVNTHGFSYRREEYRAGKTIDGDFTAESEEIKFKLIDDAKSDDPTSSHRP